MGTHWHKQIDSQVKIVERPESATSQVTAERIQSSLSNRNERHTDGITRSGGVDVGYRSKNENSDDRPEWARRFVDYDITSVSTQGSGYNLQHTIFEYAGCIASLSKSRERT